MRQAMHVLLLFAACFLSASAVNAESANQQPKKLDTQARVELDYLLYLPPDYEKQDKWPLVLFLHGAGERGDNLDLVKVHGLPKLIDKGKQFPFIVVSPQCRLDRWWPSQTLELTTLLDRVAAEYKVDPDRIYVTGLSMGGFGTWALALRTPHRFAAIVPICGGAEPLLARTIAHLPIWTFHGAKDFVVPLKRSEEIVEALKRNKSDVKLTVYPEAGHDSWTATYDNPELYEWLLQQKRKPEVEKKP